MTNSLTLSRTYFFPTEKVFEKYSNPLALARWWGPKGFTNTFHSFDFVNGGHWVFTMHSPDGQNYANEHIFHRIEKNHIITEHIVEPHFQTEIILEEFGERETKMTWISTFESAEFLEKMRDFLIEKMEKTSIDSKKNGRIIKNNPIYVHRKSNIGKSGLFGESSSHLRVGKLHI